MHDNNFTVEAFYDGGMNAFEIIPNEGHFGVYDNGELIAEIQENETWEITSGELDEDVFVSIKQAVEKRYS